MRTVSPREYTEIDGQYTVVVHTQAGGIEDLSYESSLGGNG